MEDTNFTDFTRNVKEIIKKELPKYLSGTAFSQKKITDTPTDALDVVNRAFVTNNGVTANRPPAPVIGQPFLDLSLGAHGKPIWYTSAGWIDATGTLV